MKTIANKEAKYISRMDAAAILGVSSQTISNYIDKGLLKSKRNGKVNTFIVVSEDSVMELLEKEKINGVNQESIDQHVASLKEMSAKVVAEEDSMRDYLGRLGGINIAELLPNMLEIFIDAEKDARRKEILTMLCNRCSVGEIADVMELSRERVRQIVVRMLTNAADNITSYLDIRNENESLKIENARLKFENEKLMEKVTPVIENDGRVTKETPVSEIAWRLKQMKIMDINIPYRPKNILRANEIDTVYDIVKMNKMDLFKLRNMGKKSVCDIEEFLEDNGLEFGMNI